MLQPAGFKHRKVHKVSTGGVGLRNISLGFGEYGLKVIESGILQSREIEAGRMTIKRGLKKTGIMWVRKFPDIAITGKKSGVRMGKGKGPVVGWVCGIKAGEIVFELGGVNRKVAEAVLTRVGSKLSVKSKFVVLKE